MGPATLDTITDEVQAFQGHLCRATCTIALPRKPMSQWFNHCCSRLRDFPTNSSLVICLRDSVSRSSLKAKGSLDGINLRLNAAGLGDGWLVSQCTLLLLLL